MSVRVNLLPGDVQARGRASRGRAMGVAGSLLFLLLLGALTFLQRQSIDDAEQRLADAQAVNTALQADIAALQPFADLEQRAEQAAETVTLALGGEISMASILQDLSAVMPPGAELNSLQVTLTEADESPSAGGQRPIRGRISATGRVVGIAPGVERLLIDLGRVASFDNVYVTSATTDEDGATSFSLEIELGPEVLTGRYQVVAEGAQS